MREKKKREKIDEELAVLEAQLRREIESRLARGQSVSEEELTALTPPPAPAPPALHAAAGDD